MFDPMEELTSALHSSRLPLFSVVLFHFHSLKHEYVALHLQWQQQVHDRFIYSVFAG